MSKNAFDQSLYAKYLGVLSLLGRITHYNRLSSDDRASVDRAFADANKVLEARGSDVRFMRATPGCYATFDHKG
jgi:hypothetical protein